VIIDGSPRPLRERLGLPFTLCGPAKMNPAARGRLSSATASSGARMIPMGVHRAVLVLLVPCLLLVGGCSSRPAGETERHRHGAKVNVLDFMKNTSTYKGKSITLELKVNEHNEHSFRSQGRSLRDYVGKDLEFTTLGPKVEQLKLVITIPQGVSISDDTSDEVFVTFLCTRGDLRRGNQARIIEKP